MCAPYGVLGLKAEEEAGGEVLDVVHAVHVTRGPRGLGQQITCEYCGKCNSIKEGRKKNLQTEERSPMCCMSVRLVLQLYLFFVAFMLQVHSKNALTILLHQFAPVSRAMECMALIISSKWVSLNCALGKLCWLHKNFWIFIMQKSWQW